MNESWNESITLCRRFEKIRRHLPGRQKYYDDLGKNILSAAEIRLGASEMQVPWLNCLQEITEIYNIIINQINTG
jgi:hypothetical protein